MDTLRWCLAHDALERATGKVNPLPAVPARAEGTQAEGTGEAAQHRIFSAGLVRLLLQELWCIRAGVDPPGREFFCGLACSRLMDESGDDVFVRGSPYGVDSNPQEAPMCT